MSLFETTKIHITAIITAYQMKASKRQSDTTKIESVRVPECHNKNANGQKGQYGQKGQGDF